MIGMRLSGAGLLLSLPSTLYWRLKVDMVRADMVNYFFMLLILLFFLRTSATCAELKMFQYNKNGNNFIEFVGTIRIFGDKPDDEYYNYQDYLRLINAEEAWYRTKGSKNTYVGIIDTGVDFSNPDLQENIWKNPEEVCNDGIDNDGNGYVDDCYGWNAITEKGDAYDDNGHGTSIASIIGAVGNNGIGIAGINWHIKIIPCKALDKLGEGTILSEVKCMRYFLDLKRKKGLNIIAINASYGGEYQCFRIRDDGTRIENSCLEKDLIKELLNEGILFITAAGNSNVNVDEKSVRPCKYSVELDNVICVGSVNEYGKRSTFSNFGKVSVQVYAIGENVLVLDKNPYCKYSSGTSIAAAMVSGAVALLKSYQPNLSMEELRKIIMFGGNNNLNLAGESYTCNTIDLAKIVGYAEYTHYNVCLDKNQIKFENENVVSLNIRNTGLNALSISDVRIEGSSDFKISKNTCLGEELNPEETCLIQVSRNPDSYSNSTDPFLVIEGFTTVYIPILVDWRVNEINEVEDKSIREMFKCIPEQAEGGSENVNSSPTAGEGGGCNTNGGTVYLILSLLLIIKIAIRAKKIL